MIGTFSGKGASIEKRTQLPLTNSILVSISVRKSTTVLWALRPIK